MHTDTSHILAALDDEQRAAVLAPPGPVRVLAGAGTGKTRTITHRIAYHAQLGTAPARSTLAVTHSAKAAAEMRERLAALGTTGVQARTFHAAALRQLRFFWPAAGRPGSGPVLIDAVRGGRYGMLRGSLAATLGVRPSDVDSTAVVELDGEVTWAHARRVTPETYLAAAAAANRGGVLPTQAVAAAYARYEDTKLAAQVLDFDDLLSVTADMLETDADVAARVRAQYTSFVVDEYQDTDAAQQRLLDAWLGDRDALTVVGDELQAIYSFKGADPTLLTTFHQRYPHAVSVTLVRDYRSTPQVVAAANRLMRGAGAGVRLEGQQPSGPAPQVRSYPTEAAETAGVVTTVRELLAAGTPAREIAVLHRFNAQSPALRAALTDAGVPVAVKADDGFYARPEIVDVLTRVRVVASRAPGTAGLTALDQALTAGGFDPGNPPAGAGMARERWETRNALRDMVRALPDAATLTAQSVAGELTRRADREHVPTGPDAVSVITIHKAKGLEWDAVLLPRLTDGSLPSALATSNEELAEERRLAYVAVTRARRTLVCSYAETWGDNNRRTTPSPFLSAIREPRPAATATRPSGRFSGQRRAGSRTAPADSGKLRTAVDGYAVGDRVSHDRHGLGRVTAVRGNDRQVLTVDFGDGPARTVHPAREPVVKL